MNLSEEERSVPAGAAQETAVTTPGPRLPCRPARRPSTFPQFAGEKQWPCSWQGRPRARSEATPGWNPHRRAAQLTLGLGAWGSGGRVATSLQLSFWEETRCIIYRACTANLYQLSTNACAEPKRGSREQEGEPEEFLLMGPLWQLWL